MYTNRLCWELNGLTYTFGHPVKYDHLKKITYYEPSPEESIKFAEAFMESQE